MSYHIVFTGQLKAGLSKDETIERLSRMSGLSKEKAEQRFFSGKAVKLKSAESREAAEAIVQRLSDKGVVAEVRPAPQAEATGAATGRSPTPSTSTGKPSTKQRRRWPLIAACAVVVIAVGVGGAAYYLQSLFDTRVPTLVNRAENTLLNDDAVMLGHINVAQLARLEGLLRGNAGGADPASMVGQLLAAGIDPREDISQVVFSFNFNQTTGPYLSAVMMTSAAPGNVRAFLQDHYQVESERDGSLEVLGFQQQDKDTCRYSEQRGMVIGDGLVIISHPQKVADLYRQLQNADGTTPLNQQWEAYRSQRLASIGILQPDQVNDAPLGFEGLFLSGLRSQWESMESVFMGVKGEVVPPAVSFDLTVASDDAQWVSQSRDKLQELLEADSPDESELFSLVRSKLAVTAQANQLQGQFTIDRELVSAGEKMLRDGMGAIISIGNGGGMAMGGQQEQIDENPQQYVESVNPDEIPEFENQYNENFDWVDGPFAGRIERIGINRDGLTTLEIAVKTQNLPNPPSSRFDSSPGITQLDVKDADGQSLLQVETCGDDLNHEPAPFQFGGTATKTVRLKPGATIDDVATIEGRVTKHVAIAIESEMISLPLQQHVFRNSESQIKFQQVEGGSVNYQLSGEPGGFLAMRALNKDKQYLSSGGSSSISSAVSQQFMGDVQFIELIRATEYVTLERTFTLHEARPKHRDGGFGQKIPDSFSYDVDDWDNVLRIAETLTPPEENSGWLGQPVAKTQAGPAILSLYQPKIHRGLESLQFNSYLRVELPFVEALEEKPNAIQLTVEQARFASAQPLFPLSTTQLRASISNLDPDNRIINRSQSVEELRQTTYLSGRTSIKVPLPKEFSSDAALQQMAGTLAFHLPTATRTETFSPPRLGTQMDVGDFTLQVVEIGSGDLTLQVQGDYTSLIDVMVLNGENEILDNSIDFDEEQSRFGVKPNHAGEPEPPTRMLGKLHFIGKPEALAVVVADETQVFRYPFELTVAP